MDNKPLINRLLSGIVIVKIKGTYVYIKPAKVEDKAFADFFAHEIYQDSLLEGILTRQDVEELLTEKGWWDEEKEEKIKTLGKNLEQMKLDYYAHFFREDTKNYIKKNIVRQKKNINNLWEEKTWCFDKTCEYVRDYAKTAIMVERSAFFEDGSLAAKKISSHILVNAFLKELLDDEQIREAAKGAEWRIVWNSTKDATNIFKLNGCDLTNEQISLVAWSRFYDGVYESMERPNEEIIKDNLALDGWSISQERKRKEEEKKQEGEKLAGNAQDAGEVFIPVSNQKEQDQVLALNDSYGKSVIKSKSKQFEKGGVFNENQLTHVKKEIQMESLRQAKESRR